MAEKTIIQKLLIKEGYRFLVVRRLPEGYAVALADLPAGVVVVTGLNDPGPFDLIQAFVSSQAALRHNWAG